MLTVADCSNLVFFLQRRTSFANLEEAKAGVLVEGRLKAEITRLQEQAKAAEASDVVQVPE